MTAVIIKLTAARERRLEVLRREVRDCERAVAACRHGTWEREGSEAELAGALERLSVAEGMPRRL